MKHWFTSNSSNFFTYDVVRMQFYDKKLMRGKYTSLMSKYIITRQLHIDYDFDSDILFAYYDFHWTINKQGMTFHYK